MKVLRYQKYQQLKIENFLDYEEVVFIFSWSFAIIPKIVGIFKGLNFLRILNCDVKMDLITTTTIDMALDDKKEIGFTS